MMNEARLKSKEKFMLTNGGDSLSLTQLLSFKRRIKAPLN